MRLPGVCIVCRQPVLWNGRYWKDPVRGMGRRHVCPQDRPTCGAWMPRAQDRCARTPGHGYDHKSRYALDNARLGSYDPQVSRQATPHHTTRPSSRLPRLTLGRVTLA